MDNLDNGTTNVNDVNAGNSGDGNNANPPIDAGNSADGNGQPPAKPSAELFDWAKDERFDRMWKKIPNEMYKSYRNLEKVYEPAKQKLSEYEKRDKEIHKLADDFGVSFDKMHDALTELKTLKDPERPENQALEELKYWINNEFTREQVVKFFDQLNREETTRKYPGMNSEQIQKMTEMEKRTSELEAKAKREEYQKSYDAELQTITKSEERIKQFADTKGFAVTPEIMQKLKEHCLKEGIAPKHMFPTFIEVYNAELDKAYAEKVKSAQLKELNKNKGSTIVTGGSPAKSAVTSGDLRSRLRSLIQT